jgi:hypothetical protein
MAVGKHTQRRPRRLPLAVAAAALVMVFTAPAQHASNWRGYKKADGLAESDSETVTLGSNGKILVTHRFGISQLDGYSVTNFSAPDGGALRASETPSGQAWALTRDGLAEKKGDRWISYALSGIPAVFNATLADGEPMPAFLPVRQGRAVFVTQAALMEIDSEYPAHPDVRQLRSSAQTRIGKYLDICSATDGSVWISGEHGVAKLAGPLRNLNTDSPWQEFIAPASLHARNFRRLTENDGLMCVADNSTNTERVAVLFANNTWKVFPADGKKITHAWRGSDRKIWAMTEDSLLTWNDKRLGFRENDVVSARRFNDIAMEPGGAFWLATSEGLYRSAPSIWSVPAGLDEFTGPIDSPAPIYTRLTPPASTTPVRCQPR